VKKRIIEKYETKYEVVAPKNSKATTVFYRKLGENPGQNFHIKTILRYSNSNVVAFCFHH